MIRKTIFAVATVAALGAAALTPKLPPVAGARVAAAFTAAAFTVMGATVTRAAVSVSW
jgi:hypothetical protein